MSALFNCIVIVLTREYKLHVLPEFTSESVSILVLDLNAREMVLFISLSDARCGTYQDARTSTPTLPVDNK